MENNKNYQNYSSRHTWNFAEALVFVVAIICVKEVIVDGLKLLTGSNDSKKEEK